MTEDEAKTSPCIGPAPHNTGIARAAVELGGASIFLCRGSACRMAWRWDDADSLDKPTRVHPNVLKDHWKGWTVTDDRPDEKGYVEISPPPPKLPHGHCGLAGKP